MDPTLPSLTRPLPEGVRSNWRLAVNGEPVSEVRHVVLDHPAFGTLSYGLTAAGYDGWTFHEPGGGGAVIVPFVRGERGVLVGLIEQSRPHQGGRVLQVPRGFIDPGESHAEAARRELLEEMGIGGNATLAELPGEPANPNSTFFETAAPGEGVRFFGLEVPRASVVGGPARMTFAAGVVDASRRARRQRLAEQIGVAVFLPWREASRLGDMFTVAGVARLLAALDDEPR